MDINKLIKELEKLRDDNEISKVSILRALNDTCFCIEDIIGISINLNDDCIILIPEYLN